MPNLLSVRFSKVGYVDARLDGLAYSVSQEGEPKNSLIIGSNSGGKTSQLHLLFSIFLPQKHDLISKKDNSARDFAYYFEENEIAFVVTEWTIPNNQPDLYGKQKTRVIGRFTQFTNRARYEHETNFFSFIADGELGIDDLPITSSIPSRVKDYCRTVSEVKRYLRDKFDKPGREFFGPSDRMEHWQEYLRSIGFNIDMYRLMMLFTLSEGDPASFLKKFCNQEAVLGFVTKEVMDKSSTLRLRDMLVQYRDSIRSAPITRRQIAAYNGLFEIFQQMEPVARDLSQAIMQHRKTLGDLSIVAAGIEATLSREQERRTSLLKIQETENTLLASEQKALSSAEGELRGVKECLAELACVAAKEEHLQCKKNLEEAKKVEKAVRALVDRVAVGAAEKERDDLARRLDAISEPVRSLADELAMAEYLFVEYLKENISDASANAARLEDAEKNATQHRKNLEGERQEQEKRQEKLSTEREILNAAEDARNRSLLSMVAAGFLKSGDSPSAALAALDKEVAEDTKLQQLSKADIVNFKVSIATVKEKIKEKAARIDRLKEDHARSVAKRDSYLRDYDKVAGLQGIRDAFPLAEPDLFLSGLKEKLQSEITRAENDIRLLHQEVDSLSERIEAIENNGGLLPAADDVETVIGTLRTANISSYSWWQVFSRQNRSAEESTAETKKDPFRIGGVAVLGERELSHARQILAEGCNVLSPVFVSDYSLEIREQEQHGFVVLPDVALAMDRSRAEQFCISARAEIVEKEKKLKLVTAAQGIFTTARESLLGFLGAYHDASLTVIEESIKATEKSMVSCAEEQQALTDEEKSASMHLGEAETAMQGYETKLSAAQQPTSSLREHISRHESERAEKLQRLQELADAIADVATTVEEYDEKIKAAEAVEYDCRVKSEQGRADLTKVEGEMASLAGRRKLPTDSFRQLATSTSSARALHAEKQKALDSANADAEYIAVNERFKGAKELHATLLEKWHLVHGKTPAVDLARVEALSAGTPNEADYKMAANEWEAAVRAEGVAAAEWKRMVEIRDTCKKEHRNLQVIPCRLQHSECIAKEGLLQETIAGFMRSIERRGATIVASSIGLEDVKLQVTMLNSLMEQIQLPPDVHLPSDAAPDAYFDHTAAKNAFSTAKKAVSEGEARVTAFTESLRTHNSTLAEFLDSDSCGSIATMVSHIKEEIHRCQGFLKDDIGEFCNRIHNALEPLKYELNQHEKNEREVIDQVMLDVAKVFGLLLKFEKRSKIPALGGIWRQWTGRPFIRFKTQVKPESEEARQAVAGAITSMAQLNDDLPPGDVIIHSALLAALGNAYVIDTLKPDTSPTTDYSGITHPTGLYSWSGGQKLSGAILFYLALCNLLSLEGQTGNVLLMDNPFGTCNNIEFVRLILALTHQYGVQLVAFTPTEDMQIRRLFPLNVMTRKGGADGIAKSTGRPVVRYDGTIYHDGEVAVLEINQEVPSNESP